MTQASAAGNWDAWNRLCAALACARPLGSSVDDWHAEPDAFQPASAYSWPRAGSLMMGDIEHEISREARRIGAALLAAYQPGKAGAGRAAMARLYGISEGRVALIIQRAEELRALGDTLSAH